MPPAQRRSSLAQKLLSGGAWALGGRMVAAAGTLAVSALATRLLSPTEVGVYFLALSIATALAVVARGGLEKAILSIVAESLSRKDEGRARQAVRWAFGSAAALVVLVGFTIALGGSRVAEALFGSEALASISFVLVGWMAYLTFELLIAETFRGFDQIPLASAFSGALSRIFVVTGLCLLYLSGRGGLQVVAATTVSAGLLTLLPAGFALTRRLRRVTHAAAIPIAPKDVWRVASPLFVTNIAFFISRNADLWILAGFRPEDEVALYGVAVRLVLLVGMSLSIVDAVLPPVIAQIANQGDRQRLEDVTRATATVAGLPAGLALSGLVVFGAPLLGVMFGPFYRNAHTLLIILSIGQGANVYAGSCGYVLIMTGHQTELMRAALVGGATSIAGAVVLVHFWGPYGVAGAAALGMLVQNLLMLLYVRHRCGIWTTFSLRHLAQAVTRIRHLTRRVHLNRGA